MTKAMNPRVAAAFAATLALGTALLAPGASAHAPYVPPGQAQMLAAGPPAFDGKVLVRIAPGEAAALRAEAPHGLARMREVSPMLRGLATSYAVRGAVPAIEERNLIPEARDLGLDRWFVIEVDPGAGFTAVAARLRALGGEFVEPNLLEAKLTVAPNDSLFAQNWGHGNTGTFPSFSFGTLKHTGPNVGTINFDANVQGGWAAPTGYGSSSIVVAILDTGVDPTHPDLNQVAGYDYFDNDADPSDTHGHGTGCAGIAAGIAHNTRGVAGSAGGCRIMPLRVTNASAFSPAGMANAILHTSVNGAKVASMSLDLPRSQIMADALTAADAAGVVLLAATGNNNASFIAFPANHPKVIAVGAASPCGGRKRSSNNPGLVNPGVSTDSLGVSCDNETWWGSSWGVAVANDSAAVDLVGPTMLPTTDIQGVAGMDTTGYAQFFNGTSCASPYVAGVAALVRSQHPTWTVAQVRQRLVETAIELNDAQTPIGWDKYTGYGMVNAGLPDVVPVTFAGWAAPIVPRPTADATFASVPAPTFLNGDVNCFVARNARNIGEAHAGVDQGLMLLDGVQVGTLNYTLQAGASAFSLFNATLVRGGRHVLGVSLDSNGDMVESDETNNRTARQWSWTPASIPYTVNAVVTRLAPPARLAGRADVPVSETTYDNVDAVRMTGPPIGSSSQYWVMGLSANADATDLDLGLHATANSATGMFTTGTDLITSELGAGSTEWALWDLQGDQIGAIDATSTGISGTGASVFESHLAEGFYTGFAGSNVAIPGYDFTAGMMVAVHGLFVHPGYEGPVTLELTSTAPLRMAIYDQGFTVSNRAGAAQLSVPYGSGQILSRTLPSGKHAIVVYRDRADGTAPLTYSIEVRRTPAELVTSTGGFFYAPSGVFKDGAGDYTTAPPALDGNVPNTYFYYGFGNAGPTTATGFSVRELIDGSEYLSFLSGDHGPGEYSFLLSWLRTVRGGRHTLGFMTDFANVVAELDESNNDHASQWVWSPLPLTMEVPVTRAMPPDPTGGWAQVPQPATLYDNVDGLVTPALGPVGDDGFWNFFASAPRAASDDVDLAAYEPVSTGPSSGFGLPNDASLLPAGRTDFVGIDVQDAWRQIDFGLVKGEGAGDVVVHGTRSLFSINDLGTLGPYTLDPDELVLAVEFRSTGAPRQIRLLNDAGNADLDLHYFERTGEWLDFYVPPMAQTAEANGDGVDEVLQVAPAFGIYPVVVVTKRGSGDIGKTATFRIEFGTSTVDVPDELPLPTAVRLAPVVPNPVRANASIAFELPRDAAVELSAYDVAGRRVATLASGTWTAGRHAVSWSPSAGSGTRLASGVYLVKLEADGVESVRRVVVTR